MNPDEIRARIEQIDADIAYVAAAARALHQDDNGELRDLADDSDDRRQLDEGLALIEQLKEERAKHVADLERHDRIQRAADVPAGAVPGTAQQQPSFNVDRGTEPYSGEDVRRLSYSEARDKALQLLEDRDATAHLDDLDGVERQHTDPNGKVTVTTNLDADAMKRRIERLVRTRTRNLDGGQLARRMIITENPAYRQAFMKMVTAPTPALDLDEQRAIRAFEEFRAMSIGVDASGGYGVPVLIDPTIILTAQGSLNPFRRISRVEVITTDEWKGVSSAGVTWSYDAEGAQVSDDSPTLAQPVVTAHMARGFIPYSIEIGGDYPGFASEMSTLLMEGYDELQAQAFATGSGSGQPFGIFTALDANTNVEVSVTTDGAFGGVDINKVWGALPDRWKSNATWVMSHDVGNEVATFGNSNNLSFVTVDLTGVVEKIRNRPIEFSSYAPDFTGTTGAANILTVGDFRNYLIAERAGMSVELIPHLFHESNNRPSGQRGWFAWARHGADSVNDLAFRLLQNT